MIILISMKENLTALQIYDLDHLTNDSGFKLTHLY